MARAGTSMGMALLRVADAPGVLLRMAWARTVRAERAAWAPTIPPLVIDWVPTSVFVLFMGLVYAPLCPLMTLPVATFFAAGVTRHASGAEFWDDVYGFNFSRVADEIQEEALGARMARVLPVPSASVVTHTERIQTLDLVTAMPADQEFTTEFQLRHDPARCTEEGGHTVVVGVVVWFDTEFSARFCKEHPVTLTTSPHAPLTHWAQTLFDLKTPVVLKCSDAPGLAPSGGAGGAGALGTATCPAASLWCRMSVIRSTRHRSFDV
jgi:protein arginine N-methyltransferase 3